MPHHERNKWRVSVCIDGARLSKVFDTKRQAADWEVQKAKKSPGSRLLRKSEIPTFQELAEKYLKDHEALIPAGTFVKWKADLVNHAYPEIGHVRVTEIALPHLIPMVQDLVRRGYCGQTIRNIFSAMSKIFTFGIDDEVVSANPVQLLWKAKSVRALRENGALRKTTGRNDLIWNFEERDQFLAYMREHHWEAFLAYMTYLLTGARASELRGLLRDCLDFQSWTVTIRRTWLQREKRLSEKLKHGGEPRTIKLGAQIFSLLAEKRSLAFDARVFPNITDTFLWKKRTQWMREAGVPVITNHAMRGSFASQLLKMGLDVEAIQRFLGHKDIATTFEYLKQFRDAEVGDPLILIETQQASSWLKPSESAQVIPLTNGVAQPEGGEKQSKPNYVATIGRPKKSSNEEAQLFRSGGVG